MMSTETMSLAIADGLQIKSSPGTREQTMLLSLMGIRCVLANGQKS
jgi:hypothetical protein